MSLSNLFWKNAGVTRSLLAMPFKTEDEFEKTVYQTQEIFEDIFPLNRQIRGGKKTDIPDIIGIDNDGKVCIIEMKNEVVDSSIIPQVLKYAFWAETNPDSIKALWYECENKPDNLATRWDSLEVRIIIIAPKILRSTLDIVEKINYQVDLVEVNRWADGNNSFFLVTRLEQEKKATKVKPVSGLAIYDEEFYKNEYNKNSVVQFMKYTKELDDLVKEHGWPLEMKFNKSYCGWKAGFFNAFGIQWVGSKTFAFFIKLSESEASEAGPEMTKYETQWKQATYYIEPGKTKIKQYLPLFEKAYKKISGR